MMIARQRRRPRDADSTRTHVRTRKGNGRSVREGQAIIELAVIGLVLLTMSFGVLEIGRAYYASIAVTHAARDGARVAMNPATSDGDVIAAAESAAEPINLSNVSLARSTTVGQYSTITVTYEFEPFTPFVANLWGGGPLTISESATSRVGWQ